MANTHNIQEILNTRLSSLPSLPVWERENLVIVPNEKDIFIKSKLIPAETNFPNVGINGFRVERGTFEVQVKAVRQTGWGEQAKLVDRILAHFPRNLELVNDPDTDEDLIKIHIRKSFARPGLFDSNGRYSIPVHIRYETYILI